MQSFNSRPCEGATLKIYGGAGWGRVSIHAPVKGRLVDLAYSWLIADVSIHAPVKGRQHDDLADPEYYKFQFTPL